MFFVLLIQLTLFTVQCHVFPVSNSLRKPRNTKQEKKKNKEKERKRRKELEAVVKKELEERKMSKQEQEDILRKNMFLAGYQLREYEFEVITELKIRESDGELKYFVIWDVRGSWHIEAELGPSIKELCLKLRKEAGIPERNSKTST